MDKILLTTFQEAVDKLVTKLETDEEIEAAEVVPFAGIVDFCVACINQE